jgi:acyl-coenzyme A thioesterase PaaI-like protein
VALERPLNGHLFGADQPCFGCGPQHSSGFKLAFERDGDAVVTTVRPGDHHQGVPGLLHGGLAGLLCDEIAAWAIIANQGKFGFTTSMNVRFTGPLRITDDIAGRGWIVRDGRRLVDTAVTLSQGGVVAVEAGLRSAILDRKGAEKLLLSDLPADWLRFVR